MHPLLAAAAALVWLQDSTYCAHINSYQASVMESHGSHEVSSKVISVPPFATIIEDLQPLTNHSIRVQCANEMGVSPFTDWLYFQTLDSGIQYAAEC
ncbi:hypothetical protein FKM82_001318 [Ascaphus truei]